jgi:hypothetical protein
MSSVIKLFVFVCILSMAGICQTPRDYVTSIDVSTINNEQRVTVNGGGLGWFIADGSAQSDYWMSLLLRSSTGVERLFWTSNSEYCRKWFSITVTKNTEGKILSMTGTLNVWRYDNANWHQDF